MTRPAATAPCQLEGVAMGDKTFCILAGVGLAIKAARSQQNVTSNIEYNPMPKAYTIPLKDVQDVAHPRAPKCGNPLDELDFLLRPSMGTPLCLQGPKIHSKASHIPFEDIQVCAAGF